jgi:hypothetical protein
MSDDQATPLNSARVNSERFPSELGAVWYAANFYYEASLRRTVEYCGVVFRDNKSGQFGITVRRGHDPGKVTIIPDVPASTIPVAVWHTHLPAAKSSHYPAANVLYSYIYEAMYGVTLEEVFSDADKDLSKDWSKKFSRPIPIYLVTGTVIKRFNPTGGLNGRWQKDLPSRMRK